MMRGVGLMAPTFITPFYMHFSMSTKQISSNYTISKTIPPVTANLNLEHNLEILTCKA